MPDLGGSVEPGARGPRKINSLRQNFKINFQKKICYKKKSFTNYIFRKKNIKFTCRKILKNFDNTL